MPNSQGFHSPRRLVGKVALVTGASKGIGAAIAGRLAAEGASVIVNYASSRDDAERVVAGIKKADGRAVAVRADVSKPADIDRLFAEANNAFGTVDVLVNNAGIYQFAPIEEITPESFHRMFDLNVLGLLLTTQAAVRQFSESGGSVINISSVVSVDPLPAASVYSATKAAVDNMTRALARELGPRKIRINAINPGMVETEGVVSAGIAESELRTQFEQQTPLGRIGQPNDIAGAAAFLASDEASWITGETLLISGGMR